MNKKKDHNIYDIVIHVLLKICSEELWEICLFMMYSTVQDNGNNIEPCQDFNSYSSCISREIFLSSNYSRVYVINDRLLYQNIKTDLVSM